MDDWQKRMFLGMTLWGVIIMLLYTLMTSIGR